MAEELVAYGEITILDFADTATYIYYADDAEGTNPSANPAGKIYIGVYNGPSLEGGQPDKPPQGTKWTKYVGENGTGFYRVITKLRRFTQSQWNQYNYYGHEENWSYQTDEETPDSNLSLNSHIKIGDTAYVAGVITDRGNLSCMLIGTVITVNSSGVKIKTTNFIVGEKGEDGKDAEAYDIETNQNEVLKFYTASTLSKWSTSPSVLSFKIFKRPKNTDNPITLIKDGVTGKISNFDFGYINNGTYVSLQQYVDVSGEGNEAIKEGVEAQIEFEKILNEVPIFHLKETEANSLSLKIIFKNDKGEEIANKIISYTNGTHDDMAKFNLNAADITMAIQKAKLKFSADGLDIYNGGIRINKVEDQNKEVKVFEVDDNGDLTLTGTIYATNGKFTGEIEANSGFIGGFKIVDNILYSTDSETAPSIKLDGASGEIVANNITLGEGAIIADSINLGQAKLYNPENYEGKVLQSGDIILKEDGTMTLGGISIDKDNENNYFIKSNNNNWNISASGVAKFNDVYANNIHIQNSILEMGSVQSLGSLMLVKDAWIVTEVSENDKTITLDLRPTRILNLKINDYIYDGIDTYKIQDINLVDQDDKGQADFARVGLYTSFKKNRDTVTKFGTPGKDCILSFLGEKREFNPWSFATGNSITLSDFKEINGSLEYNKVLILGDLSGKSEGTGLYAENVELYGSLTTSISVDNIEPIYAGINTKSNKTSQKFADETVIFFAGANSREGIGSAPFHITNKGNIYASQGRFEGAIITESVIKGGEIHTAEIYGTGSSPALTIYDTKKGISFKNIAKEETLLLSDSGFVNNSGTFINLGAGEAAFKGSQFETSEIILEGNKITSKNTAVSLNGSGIYFNSQEGSSLEITADQINGKKPIYLYQDIYFGEEGNQHYKQIKNSNKKIIGYDLYIK